MTRSHGSYVEKMFSVSRQCFTPPLFVALPKPRAENMSLRRDHRPPGDIIERETL